MSRNSVKKKRASISQLSSRCIVFHKKCYIFVPSLYQASCIFFLSTKGRLQLGGSIFPHLLGVRSSLLVLAVRTGWKTGILMLMATVSGQSYFSCFALPASKFPVKIKASWCAERSSGNHVDESRDRTMPATPIVQPFWDSSEGLGWETLQVQFWNIITFFPSFIASLKS